MEDYSHAWFAGGMVIGILVSIGVFFAAAEAVVMAKQALRGKIGNYTRAKLDQIIKQNAGSGGGGSGDITSVVWHWFVWRKYIRSSNFKS